MEQVDQPRLQHQPAGPRARHGAALSDRRRPGAAALHLAGELAAGQPAGADVVAGRRSAGDIYERLGPYRTLGWAEATWPLNEDRIDEKTFMEDLYRAFDDRAQVILQRIDAKQWDLLVGVIESTDRVQHMMWRLIDPAHPMYDKALAAQFGDSIERVYRKCDEFVGEVMARVDRGDADPRSSRTMASTRSASR